MSGLEFEQKFVLDPRHAVAIQHELVARMIGSGEVIYIRQYYDKEGGRFRCINRGNCEFIYIKETKRSIKIGTKYSITDEKESKIKEDEFEFGWEKNRNRRLQKTRYITPGRYSHHQIMVDFFHTFLDSSEVYAVIAEVETILHPETTTLHLDFCLPIYLQRYCLLTVDDSDPDMKIFKSANMVDSSEDIEAVKKAISRLHD